MRECHGSHGRGWYGCQDDGCHPYRNWYRDVDGDKKLPGGEGPYLGLKKSPKKFK